ncbi:MAG: PadR family transcriptional regulator [Mycobacterium sp.]
MTLAHAILVSLREQPGSGYELTHRFDRSIGQFWRTTHQQIYRTLRTMENDGWVQVTAAPQDGRPDKKVHTVTEAGRTELARWISAPLRPRGDTGTRDLAVKLRGASYGDVEAVSAQAVTLRAERAARLATYHAYEKQHFPDPSRLSGAALHQHLVLRGGIRAEQNTIEWLDEVVAGLRR